MSSVNVLSNILDLTKNADGTVSLTLQLKIDGSNITLGSSPAPTPAPTPIVLPIVTPVQGAFQFYRFQFLDNCGDPFLGIQELQMFGLKDSPTVVSLLTPTTPTSQSSYYVEGTLTATAAKLVDGNLTDAFGGAFVSGKRMFPVQVSVDLSAPCTVTSFTILPQAYAGGLGRAPKNFYLQASNDTGDLKTWTNIVACGSVAGWKIGVAQTFPTGMTPVVVTPPAPGPTPPAPGPSPAPTPAPPAPAPSPAGATLKATFERTTQAHFAYGIVPESTIASLPTGAITPTVNNPFPLNTSGTGERWDIGIVPTWDANAVISDDARVIDYSHRAANLAATMPIHNTSKATGQLFRYQDFPFASITGGDPGGLDGINLEANPNNWAVDIAHQPHFLFVPFLDAYRKHDVVRARWLLNQMQAFCTYNYLMMPYSGRGRHRCIFATQMTACDLRGSAWGNLTQFFTVASMMMLAEIDSTYTVANDPLSADLISSVQWNIKWAAETYLMDTPVFSTLLKADDLDLGNASNIGKSWADPYYTLPDGRLKNSLTVFQNSNAYDLGDGVIRIGCFMQHFFSASFQMAFGLAKAGYLPIDSQSFTYLGKVAKAAASFAVRLCGAGTPGTVDYRRGVHQYSVPVATMGADGYPNYYTSDQQLQDAIQANLGPLPSVLTSGDTEFRYHDSNNLFYFIEDGYAADIMAVLAMAVRDGVDGAQEAWDRFTFSSTFKSSSGHWPETAGGIKTAYALAPAGVVIDAVGTPPAPPAPTPPAPPPATSGSPLIAYWGDSLVDPLYGIPHPFTLANGLLGAPFNLVATLGVQGQKVSDMLARVNNRFDDPLPGLAGFTNLGAVASIAGANDARGGVPITDDVKANYTSLFAAMLQYVPVVFVLDVTPISAPSNGGVNSYNQWLDAHCAATPGLVRIHQTTTVNDGTGAWVAGFMPPPPQGDGIHYGSAAAYAMGQAAKADLAAYLVGKNYPSGLSLTGTAYPTNNQWVKNPLNVGTGGGIDGAVGTGQVVTGCGISAYGAGYKANARIDAAEVSDTNRTPWQSIIPTKVSPGSGSFLGWTVELAYPPVTPTAPTNLEVEFQIRFKNFAGQNYDSLSAFVYGDGNEALTPRQTKIPTGPNMNDTVTFRVAIPRRLPVASNQVYLQFVLQGLLEVEGDLGEVAFRNTTVWATPIVSAGTPPPAPAPAPGPSAPPPAGGPYVPPANDPSLVGTDLGVDGATVQMNVGTYAYGVTLLQDTNGGNGLVHAGSYYAPITVTTAGPKVILPGTFGVADPCGGILKHMYQLTGTPSTGPSSPPPAPAPGPSAPPPAPANRYISATDPTVVPPKGQFRTIPLTALMAVPALYSVIGGDPLKTNMENWSDGAVVIEGTKAHMVVSGAGHEGASTPNIQGNIVLDVQLGQPGVLRWTNAPTELGISSVSADLHLPIAKMNNGMLYNGHGYQQLEGIPESWGLGSNLMFRWCANGGGWRPSIYDITQPTKAEYCLFEDDTNWASDGAIESNPTTHTKSSYYAMSCRDDNRKGFWGAAPVGDGLTIFLKPFRDANGKLKATIQYWPQISGNAGRSMIYLSGADVVVCFAGTDFRGDGFGGNGFSYATIMKPGATPADAVISSAVVVPEDGKWYPNVVGNANLPQRSITDFTVSAKGTGYSVNDVLNAHTVDGLIAGLNGNAQPTQGNLVGGLAHFKVTAVDANGGITGLDFVMLNLTPSGSTKSYPHPDNGTFYSTSGYIPDSMVSFVVDGAGPGSGASILAHVVEADTTVEYEKMGLEWIESKHAAYGFSLPSHSTQTLAVRVKPSDINSLNAPWIISTIALTHDATDVHGDPMLVNASNGDFRKTRYAAPFDAWIRNAHADFNPQIVSLE